jgi:uncharacterized membrane protein (DUF4010 family)
MIARTFRRGASMNEPLLYRLAIALGIGLIVGLERGWQARDVEHGRRQAGIRTFSIAGLLGGALAAAQPAAGPWPLAAGTVAVAALVVAGYAISVRETREYGMTTELALLATFALGALAVLAAPLEAAAAAVVMTLLLGFKTEVHLVIRKLERAELLATLQLAAIAIVLLPLLPNRDVGPWNAINPRTIGLLVLLIAGLSYVGYFSVRVVGAHLGLLLTALLGGISSSTAVTVAFARRARDGAGSPALLGAGIGLAAAAMAPRVAVEVAAVNRSLLALLWPTFAVLALVPAVGALVVAVRSARDGKPDVPLENPLQLKAALTFGALLSALFIVAAGLQRTLGESAIYAMAAVTGFFDADAVSIAMADSAQRGNLAPEAAARAIALAALVNTGAKAAFAASIGGTAMLRSASAILAVALAAGAATALVTI